LQVVHTERTTEEEWFNSVMNQIQSIKGNVISRVLVNLSPSGRKLSQFFRCACEKHNKSYIILLCCITYFLYSDPGRENTGTCLFISDQETAKWTFRSSSQAATCYYQFNHSKVETSY